MILHRTRFFLALFSCFALLACSGVKMGEGYTNPQTDKKARDAQSESILGEGGLGFGGKSKSDDAGAAGIGVNGYLWRATLDTLSFMPLASADPFGGIVITDWYSPAPAASAASATDGAADAAQPAATSERFKVNVYILTKELRSDGLRVSAFKQVLQNGAWVDAPVDTKTAEQLENSILTRARELRIADGVK